MDVEALAIPDVLIVSPKKFGDSRGFFSEVFRQDAFDQRGGRLSFVQDNHVFSSDIGVLRGLHFQRAPSAQGKLVRCIRGAILDVAVDIRHGSPTFGRHVSAEISASNWRQIWVPPGFAHGYVTLEAECEVIYKVTAFYDPEAEGGIAWDDPALGIDWRLPRDRLVLAEKDRRHPTLAEAPVAFEYVDAN